MTPRWWLACDYQPLARTEDGLGWQLRGRGVKAMTEERIRQRDRDRSPGPDRSIRWLNDGLTT